MNGDYDIAVRDVNMALAAYALARSEGKRQESGQLEDLGEDASLEAA